MLTSCAGSEPTVTWIVCGRATVGASAGQVWLYGGPYCRTEAVLAHEIGHPLGFFHVDIPGSMMSPYQGAGPANDAPTERERYHAALAYARVPGNQDIDRDPQQATSLTTQIVVD